MRQVQVLTCALVVALATGAAAQDKRSDKIILDTDVKAKKGLYPLAVPMPVASDAETAKLITEVQSFDFEVSSWFTVLDPRSFLADLGREGMEIEPQKWKEVGAYGVVKSRATVSGGNVTLRFKLYEVDKGAVAVLEKEYTGSVGDTRKLTHRWANEVVKYFTGEPGFFGSQLVVSQRGRRGSKIVAMDFDGANVRTISRNDSMNILPAIAPNGRKVAFTSYMRGTADMYLQELSAAGRPVRVAKYPGMNTGAAWSPDGTRIAITLSKDDNPEIYVIDAATGRIVKRLTQNRAIDTSPAWSPDGKEIAFVSNREGTAQIYLMNADGSSQRKVSTTGSFNQTPAWNPRPGTRMLAYTARDESGRMDVLTLDLAAGNKLVRVTQGQGNNEEPTWSPNGRVLAFASARSGGTGIYLANADGTGTQHLVLRGSATSPDWGPAP